MTSSRKVFRQLPDLRRSVHVEMLERDGFDEVLAAGVKTIRPRASDGLSAAERDQISALFSKPRELIDWREFRGRVDDYGQIVIVCAV